MFLIATRKYLSYVFFLSEYNEYTHNKNFAKDLWHQAQNTERTFRELSAQRISIEQFYISVVDALKPHYLIQADLIKSYYNSDKSHLDIDSLKKVLQANAKTLRYESRKKTVFSFIMPLINILMVPLKLPAIIVDDILIKLPIDIMFGAARKASDYFEGRNTPNTQTQQSSDHKDKVATVTWSAYCCSNPITTCFNRARQCFGYGINSTQEASANLPTRQPRRMQAV